MAKITDREVQRVNAHLELARTAIDNAELALVGGTLGTREGAALLKSMALVSAASSNLQMAGEEISKVATRLAVEVMNAAPVNGSATGEPVPAEQKTGSNSVSS